MPVKSKKKIKFNFAFGIFTNFNNIHFYSYIDLNLQGIVC